MNIKLNQFTARLLATLILPFLLIILQAPVANASGVTGKSSIVRDEMEKDKKKKKKLSGKTSTVKFYPHAIRRELSVVANTGKEEEVCFMLFDLDGTLVLNYNMNSGDRKKISGLDRGIYVFSVFAGDREIESGKLTVR